MNEVKIILEDNQLDTLRNTIYISLIDEINRARKDVGLEKRYMNKKEICEYLHVANNTLDKWLELGLPRIMIGGSIRYDKRSIDEWMKQFLQK
ncbi:helix-turn-helix domain-containing protein [Vagococcus zengguangii]|uniref:Helix-turn-helix domain-containing protein n=1 Tax=Vagococcus zengguangii TaxID=2571750 RepID=A0A4D7CSB1_9ENTE|nr:helix-turn-helix domain-containing protein [Vagococcus zengguangii]QCI85542.1 helix-turn-helix domain-containing protein [Vagococcus zengguangii]TLG80088.1 helix-turn-helix domain-containing protein [Vagococcus zengguangii]